ncbi:hypothetical protein C8Q80DRAFT_1203302 [Daedaleopsis nitida]|nr:hypothetical protein C8Q80DRAFT_1203302 [Daedaleopsis nitida]
MTVTTRGRAATFAEAQAQAEAQASSSPLSQSPTLSTMSSAPLTPTRPLTPPLPTQPPLRFSPHPVPLPTQQSGTPARTSSNRATATPEKPAQGAVFILGVAILRNPRCPDPIGMPRTVVVDAAFCVGGQGSDRPLAGCFRLFNKHDLDFSDPNMCEKYVVFASVARLPEHAEAPSTNGHSWDVCDIIGDIIWIASAPDADAIKQYPLIITSGQTSNRQNDMFDLSASQYVHQLRGMGTISATVSLADNPRFKNTAKKPLPSIDGTNALVVGFLEGVKRLSNQAASSFRLVLESVVFYPRSVPSPPAYHSSSPTPASQRSARTLRFDDLNLKSSVSRGKSVKRRRLAASDDESSEDTPLATQSGPGQVSRVDGGSNDLARGGPVFMTSQDGLGDEE